MIAERTKLLLGQLKGYRRMVTGDWGLGHLGLGYRLLAYITITFPIANSQSLITNHFTRSLRLRLHLEDRQR
jgi:hypothetical protein